MYTTNSINIYNNDTMQEILHYPNLKTVLMLETALKEAEQALTREELKKRLDEKTKENLPIKNKTREEITSEFGWRIDPITGETRHHDGMDISAIEGTPIHPTRSGTVVDINSVDSYGGGYGYFVEVDHGNGLTSFYAHMSSVGKIYIRQNIDSTTIIGYVGNTGKSTGAHLHFEIRGAKNPF